MLVFPSINFSLHFILMIAVEGSSAFFCPTYPLPSRQRVRSRRLTKEKLGFNFELEQLERYPSRRSRRRYKGRCNHCTRRDGKSWRRAGGNMGVAVAAEPSSSLSAELWKIRTIPHGGVCVSVKEREGREGEARRRVCN